MKTPTGKSSAIGRGWITAISLLLWGSMGLAQDTLELELLRTLPGEFRFFTTDKLQQVYAVTTEQTVVKFTAEGQRQFDFNNHTLGELSLVDATNPFHLLLFYPDFQWVITLDRTLNPIQQYNLFDLNLPEVEAIGMANDNFIWVYDKINFRLKKLDRDGEAVAQSENLARVLPATFSPNFLLARENRLYLNSPELGIVVFDNFGQFLKILNVKGLDTFQIRADRLFFHKGQHLYALLLNNLGQNEMLLPASLAAARQIRLEKDVLYARLPDGIRLYRLKK